ncbi:glycoside hydrolase family 95 protein [Bacteroides sp.]|uniref:glycoside hydrolase family 95 protein n=1 Tax=Bacteroides sp. TaxID=29523 RepID=UPI00261FBE64|nr:glycoside hydrolase family 95 protein [Bacteroides sp.]
MKILLSFLLLVFMSVLLSAETIADSCNHQLYYNSPATIWEETLPLGNGRLGMMPDGGIDREHIVLNEISLWSGMEADYSNPDASKSLPTIQQLLFDGKNKEAQELMYSSFVPKKQETDGRYGTYQVLGDLNIDFRYPDAKTASLPVTKDYRRSLNLRDAIAYTSFIRNGVNYNREYFVSRERDVMLVHLTAGNKGALNFSARLSRAACSTLTIEGNALLMSGILDSGKPGQDGMKYRVAMQLVSKGGERTTTLENGISLKNGQDAWLILSATTSYSAEGTDFPGKRYVQVCDSLLNAANSSLQKNVSKRIVVEHIANHRALYDRVSLNLPATTDDALPTNERILRFAQKESPALAALYYNYGRYLLISGTRPGSLPPNLQGLWANGLLTPWNGDYHTNINIQMNHWPLEQAGLSELYNPLTTLVERLIPSGEATARTFYGKKADGWVLHMMTNVWNYTAPGEHPSWGATNTGGAWLCAHLWEHYLYTQDKGYLSRIYPILKGAAKFFSSTTVQEPVHGWLVTAPTSSPENSFYVPGDSVTAVSICMGPTMDVQLLTELYTNVITAARLLNCDADYIARLESDLKKFPPMQISKEGYLQEWLEDYKEVDVHHRHVSHLYGLHPGNLISPDGTPELAEACRVTLNRRGDEGTGWSRAWKINFWARLGDGDRAWKLFKSLLHPVNDAQRRYSGGGTFPNLFCAHPPFQIDGNYGGAAGIGEMLLQSHEGFINLLPALPTSWSDGRFRGMRVRGGASVGLDWKDGLASKALVTALVSGKFIIKMPAGISRATVKVGGRTYEYIEKMFSVELSEAEICEINFF